jgi:glucosamine-6-phosphate isomerase
MQIYKMPDYDAMSRKAASFFSSQIILKPDSVLGLATGSTPIGLYKSLIECYKNGEVDFADVTTVNLDEYAGLAADHPQSYRRFMQENLFDSINLPAGNINVPDGTNTDAEKECLRYEAVIDNAGGIDMQLLGIGHNGHIGFNEPDDAFATDTHKVTLTDSTIQANKRFFENEADVPRSAYTMGIRTIMKARAVVLVVSGKEKAAIVKKAFFGPVTPQVPASILQLHPNVILIGDEAALHEI